MTSMSTAAATAITTATAAAATTAAVTAISATATTTARGVFARSGFIDRQGPAIQLGAIQRGNRSLGCLRGFHRHKGKSPGAPGKFVLHQIDFGDISVGRKRVLEIILS